MAIWPRNAQDRSSLLMRLLLLMGVLTVNSVCAGGDSKISWGENEALWPQATMTDEQKKKEPSLWQASLGIGVFSAPKYEGSDKYKANVLPLLDIVFADRLFLSTIKGAGVYFFENSGWSAGAVANYVTGRKEKDSNRLKGLGDVDAYVDIGAFIEWAPGPINLSLYALQGTNGAKGSHITAAVGHEMVFFDRLQIAHSVSTTFADARYNKQYFGISAEQSANSERQYKEFHAGKGIKDVTLSASATYEITDNISTSLLAEYKRLVGPAAKSPLVKDGSKDQGQVGIGIAYTF